MPEDAELAELQRRVYGRQADLGDDPVARARLAELEAARRPVPPDPDEAGLRETGTDDSVGAGSGREPTISPDRRLAGDASWTDPSPSDAPRDEGAPDEGEPTSRRWFAPALVATSAVAAIVVMLVAGGFGWGGGYLAGWAGAAQPADHDMHLEEVLEEQELPSDVSEAPWMQMIVDPDTGETMGDIAYFGEFRSGFHVSVGGAMWGREGDIAPDRVCLQMFRVTPTDDDGWSSWGTGACGSTRAGVRFDGFVAGAVSGYGDLDVAGFAPGTLLRFIYDDATETVSVWSLPPEEETDPTA